MTILTVFGTRPEAIKLAPVIEALAQRTDWESRVCVTAQHREMLDQVLGLFNIEPDWDMRLMRANQSLFDVTANALRQLETVLSEAQPDLVLVQGDTTTTLVASLAAYYRRIPLGHVEAGLRTYDKFNPYPEEMNRRISDVLTDLFFAPTEKAQRRLVAEGFPEDSVHVTGNTVIDALYRILERQTGSGREAHLQKRFHSQYGIDLHAERKMILVTGHRRESFGEAFQNLCHGLRRIAEANDDVDVIYPVHLNPNVQEPVQRILGTIPNVHLIEPLEYDAFAWLMNQAYLILTDSGGIQEEAPSLGKPVLVMREVSERPEAIAAGTAMLVGTNEERIFAKAQELLTDSVVYDQMAQARNPYGDGQASQRIVDIIERTFSRTLRRQLERTD